MDSQPGRTTIIALFFELGLGLLALAVGWLLGFWPAPSIQSDVPSRTQLHAIGWGLAAAVPLFAVLLLIDRFPLGPLRELRRLADRIIRQMFSGASCGQLLLVSVTAGICEELLFRGLIQDGLSRLIGGLLGPWIALGIASAVFGACHWLNGTYAVLAMLAGAYFGMLLILTGNLWTPIAAHAGYDFLALIYLLQPIRWIR